MFFHKQYFLHVTVLALILAPFQFASAAVSGNSWPLGSTLFYIGDLNGTDDIWEDAFEEASKRWNDVPTSFEYNISKSSVNGICTNSGNNSTEFSSTSCGDDWGSTMVASTRSVFFGTTLVKADIVYNSAKNWGAYDGPIRSGELDFRRITVHELGHAAGLLHPVASNLIMSAFVNSTYLPALDDINSLEGVYGATNHTLTLDNAGDGVIAVTPLVPGTGIFSGNTLFTSNYGVFLDCNAPSCNIPIQDGLRLTLTAIPDTANGVEFLGWSGNADQNSSIQLDPFTISRTLVANYSIGFDNDDDGIPDTTDQDDDNDGVPDIDDLDPFDPSIGRDTDGDGIPDNTDPDDDNDGVPDVNDADPLDPAIGLDTDGDGLPDTTDPDDDNDGVPDPIDFAPLDPAIGLDTDGDGIPDITDPDDDNDSVPDVNDADPLDPAIGLDTDGDGLPDTTDPDDDNDGVPDINDADPLDPAIGLDTDGDGLPNTTDPDDDNDGVPDDVDPAPLDPTITKLSSSSSGGGGGGCVLKPGAGKDPVLPLLLFISLVLLSRRRAPNHLDSSCRSTRSDNHPGLRQKQ